MFEFDALKIEEFMQNMMIWHIPGIGKVKEAEMKILGIESVKDVFTHLGEVWAHDELENKREAIFILSSALGISQNVHEP